MRESGSATSESSSALTACRARARTLRSASLIRGRSSWLARFLVHASRIASTAWRRCRGSALRTMATTSGIIERDAQ